MNKKMSKRQKDIKSKLMAAICMLLVSSIMMVSSTYAWFTLSTAPEVTGIQTAVGANGNLEMALLPADAIANGQAKDADYGITSDVGDSLENDAKTVQQSNVTWGNLVKLDSGYGLDKITLYPAELNVANGVIDSEFILKTPTYGADGRISALNGNTSTGIYENGSFLPDEAAAARYGVRAVGTSSGLTEREQSFRSARSAMMTAASAARTAVANSLITRGKSLANIVIKYADVGANATFTNDELTSIDDMIADLEAAMAQIDIAYKNAIMALMASGGTNTFTNTLKDGEVKIAQMAFDSTSSLDAFIAKLKDPNGDSSNSNADAINTMLSTAGFVNGANGFIDQYKATAAAVAEAKSEYQTAIATKETHTWNEVVAILTNIANPDAMLVNGTPKNELDKQTLIDSVLAGDGIVITIAPGGGAYADIADHCGNYSPKVPIGGLSVRGMTLPASMTATMETKTTKNYTQGIYNVLTVPSKDSAEAMPINDFYGYVIDLGFRTNAANSNLLLQVGATDRIYTDNANEDTMGHGSNMVFTSVSPDFSNDSIKNLMGSIKLVFFKTDSREVIANAYLDADNATVTADGVKADIHIENASTTPHFAVQTGSATNDDGTTTPTYTYYYGTQEKAADNTVTTIYKDADGNNLFKTVTTPAADENSEETVAYYAWIEEEKDDAGQVLTHEAWDANATTDQDTIDSWNGSKVEWSRTSSGETIMALTQNQAVAVSVLVYLDGNSVKNADVAYNADTSMTGTLNLQFASSASLTAMKYSDLYTPGATTAPSEDAPAESQAANP